MLTLIFFFFFNDTATTEIYTLSLHDALPIFEKAREEADSQFTSTCGDGARHPKAEQVYLLEEKGRPGELMPIMEDEHGRSEEHTSELQSQSNLVCRLLLEKKKKKKHRTHTAH